MTDYFQLLQVERVPWPDQEMIKERFRGMSLGAHPDRFHNEGREARVEAGDRSAELNLAYQTLMDPAARLRHLLELEQGQAMSRGVQAVPGGLMETFLQVGQVCQNVDRFLKNRPAGGSALALAQFVKQGLVWDKQIQESVEGLQREARVVREKLVRLNPVWAERPREGLPLDELRELYQRWSYLARWESQLKERQFALTESLPA